MIYTVVSMVWYGIAGYGMVLPNKLRSFSTPPLYHQYSFFLLKMVFCFLAVFLLFLDHFSTHFQLDLLALLSTQSSRKKMKNTHFSLNDSLSSQCLYVAIEPQR